MSPARRRSVLTLVAVALAVVLALVVARWGGGAGTAAPAAGGGTTQASATRAPSGSTGRDPESGLRVVALADLPSQAGRTVALIDAGGPFPYAKDGVTFGNNEGVLPRKTRGWYREYTVPTPGSADRGARRIVTGGTAAAGLAIYYTADHYTTFARVRR